MSDESAHFKVWSCGDGDQATRASMVAEGEQLYGPMISYMGEPVPDEEDNAPGGTQKIDIYLVDFNQARLRGGTCRSIPGVAQGQAVQSPPSSTAAGSGVKISSGFFLFRSSTAAGSDRKRILLHEFFHLQQFAHSLRAVDTWLAESTATWAEQHFTTTEPDIRLVYNRFTEHPDTGTGRGFLGRVAQPLDTTGGAEVGAGYAASPAYDAFIWHYFAEQERSPSVVGDLWRALFNKDYPRVNEAVDGILPFDMNFSKFIVRNLNRSAVKEAGLKVYRGDQVNSRLFPFPTDDFSGLKQVGELKASGEIRQGVDIDYLAAQYAHFDVNANVHEITFDFSEVTGNDQVDLELLLSKSPDHVGGWRHVQLKDKRKLTLCRDTGDEPVYEVYLALGNHDWKGETRLSGTYKVTGKAMCCPPGQVCWSGTAKVVHDATSTYGTVHSTIDANVTWTSAPQDTSGMVFVPSGTATFAGHFTDLGGCVGTLAPTTLALANGGGSLYFFAGTPMTYLATGSGVQGDGILHYSYQCPTGGPTDYPSDAKPWLQMSNFRDVPDAGNLLEGTEAPGDGNVYTWHFERQ